MKIININDIEDIILAKYEIDNNNPKCEGRSDLNEFINTYCTLNDTLVIDNKLISFNYVSLFNNKYLFINDKNELDVIQKFLTSIKYDYNNLKEFSINELFTKNNYYFIHNSKYYSIY